MCNYNLFRHADRADLICAVPEIRPVPAFIVGPPWGFVGRVRECANGSSTFNHRAAEESVEYNGFYLFQLINVSDLEFWVDQDTTPHSGSEASIGRKERQREVSGFPAFAD